MERIIQELENWYFQYANLGSNVLLNLNTDLLIDKIKSLPQCHQILNNLIHEYPLTEQEIKSFVELGEIKLLFEKHSEQYYIAFCLQWYYYQKEHGASVIRPIVDFTISQIKEHNIIYYYLDRYKSRVERYTYSALSDKKELDLQNDLALYLFDQGLSFYQEPNLWNGRPDFVIDLECNGKPFVIEIKRIKKLTQGAIEVSLRQLRAYLNQLQLPAYGCLYIFTEDADYVNYSKNADEKLSIRCVYLGGKTPSQL